MDRVYTRSIIHFIHDFLNQIPLMVQLPEAAMTKNDLPSLIRETDLFVPVSKVNLLPWLLGVVPAMPANTFVPPVS